MMTKAETKIAAIVLAAGSGKRIGGAKALLPFGNSTFLGRILANLRQAEIERIIVVVSPGIRNDVDQFTDGIKMVVNDLQDADMWSSLQLGIRQVKGVDGCLIIPVDHPFVDASTYSKLIESFAEQVSCIIVPEYQGQKGHPVILPFSWAQSLPELNPEGGLRTAIRESNQTVTRIQVDDSGILRNINEPADL
jgi:CTP:molybdopterin cytidylyltransferase MocA